MKNKFLLITILTTMGLMYPWSCTPQVGVPIGGDGCDTIFIEDPGLNDKLESFEKMITRLTEENAVLLEENSGFKTEMVTLNNKIATLNTQIGTLNTQIGTLDADLLAEKEKNDGLQLSLNEIRGELENCLARPTETDTVYVDKPLDYITVNGVEYKVSEIELIKPRSETVQYEMFFCKDSITNTGERSFIHEGSVTEYPHYINIASKDRGLMKVWFETPLDSTIKVAKSWILDERRNYETAKTEYIYKSYNKF